MYPVSGMEIAIDPDIPFDQQRVFFEAQPEDSHLKWVLKNKNMKQREFFQSWQLCPGKFVLSLIDQEENVIDTVNFEVKGTYSKKSQNPDCGI